MKRVRAISFDFWNTLFREVGTTIYQKRRQESFCATVYPFQECPADEVAAAFAHTAKVCQEIWTREYRTPTACERLELVLAYLQLTIPAEAMDYLIRYNSELVYDYPPLLIEGVKEVLTQLSATYKLAVISDTGFSPGHVLRELMRHNDIYHYFDVLTFSDEIGRSKPHQSLFLSTAMALGVDVKEMLHIGDLEMTDVQGAKNVGATAVLFAADEVTTTAADFVIKTHQELPDLLALVG